MPTKTFDLAAFLRPDDIATQIADTWLRWRNSKAGWENTAKEVQRYIFAVDTTTTTNSKLPWKNKTTRPKLCQIRDNLHANYMSALFPNDRWFKWETSDEEGADKDKALSIEAFMGQKFRDCKFKQIVSRMVLDYIDYGNVIGDVEFVNEMSKDIANNPISVYVGPRPIRISPYDIVFDITAPSFEQSPRIVRSLLSFGQIQKLIATNPDWKDIEQKIDKIKENRKALIGTSKSLDTADTSKLQQFLADGFSSMRDYYTSGMVEFLEFEGDYYDPMSMRLYENHVITVVDRAYVIRQRPINNWLGRSYKQHCGWRLRPDNLMAMGPLDNLIGLQYRIDHLENLKADAFDLISFPPLKVKGYVEDFNWGPNEKIHMEQDADVESLAPDTTVLNADMQIAQLEQTMEDMAGAPKQAMGIRTPGEKTAFEYSELINAASRMFQNKIAHFEETFLEPLMNGMLEIARRNMTSEEVVKVISDDDGVTEFLSISPDDLKARGKLTPLGARRFAAQSQLMQNLAQLSASGLYADPAVKMHLSGKKLARMIEENLGLEKFGVFQPNIRIEEEAEATQLAQQANEDMQVNAMTPTATAEDELPSDQPPTQTEESLDG